MMQKKYHNYITRWIALFFAVNKLTLDTYNSASAQSVHCSLQKNSDSEKFHLMCDPVYEGDHTLDKIDMISKRQQPLTKEDTIRSNETNEEQREQRKTDNK